jgi:hypothetical protein
MYLLSDQLHTIQIYNLQQLQLRLALCTTRWGKRRLYADEQTAVLKLEQIRQSGNGS